MYEELEQRLAYLYNEAAIMRRLLKPGVDIPKRSKYYPKPMIEGELNRTEEEINYLVGLLAKYRDK